MSVTLVMLELSLKWSGKFENFLEDNIKGIEVKNLLKVRDFDFLPPLEALDQSRCQKTSKLKE